MQYITVKKIRFLLHLFGSLLASMKLKYPINLDLNMELSSKADKIIVSNRNTWSNLLQMNGQPSKHGQMWCRCMANTNENALSALPSQYIVKCKCTVSIIKCKRIVSNFQTRMHGQCGQLIQILAANPSG